MDQLVGPLEDKVVIYLCWPRPFPNAAMMLGDRGAKVIKVESPGSGDDTRGWGRLSSDRKTSDLDMLPPL
jgi:crotonobetainyl-CoA:carnitine CoA-transferase CaiB-like acyl-CoA transferase